MVVSLRLCVGLCAHLPHLGPVYIYSSDADWFHISLSPRAPAVNSLLEPEGAIHEPPLHVSAGSTKRPSVSGSLVSVSVSDCPVFTELHQFDQI